MIVMKIWLDDQIDDVDTPARWIPSGFVGCKTPKEAIKLLKTGKVSHIDFDHDLGDHVLGNGYTVALFIEREVHFGNIPAPSFAVHSANPVGAEKIRRAMRNCPIHQAE